MEIDKKVISRNIARLISKTGKSRKEICAEMNIGYSTFSEWANGRSYPRPDKIEMLAKYFSVSKAEIIEEQKAPLSLRTPAEIGNIIRERREKLGLSYDELATSANTTTMYLRRWEKGKVENPRTDAVENLAKALELPTAILRGIPLSEEEIQKQKLFAKLNEILSGICLTDEAIQTILTYVEFVTKKK